MKVKKSIVVLLSVTIIIATTSLAFCQTSLTQATEPKATPIQETPTITLNCTENQSVTWNIEDSEQQLVEQETAAKDVLVHNNGLPIQTNMFADGDAQGNYLVAVYYTEFQGVPVERYFFTNEPDRDKKALLNYVANEEMTPLTENPAFSAIAASSDIVKDYIWNHKKGSTVMAKLSTTVTFRRRTKTAEINGKKGSVWDVRSNTQYEKFKAQRINGYRTRLSVNQTNQKLISYGPVGNTSGGSVTVSLTGLSVPTLAYSFSISGFSVEDLSSKSGKYGRWSFQDKFGSMNSMTTAPAVRASNTSGSFVTELSHVATMIPPSSTSSSPDTFQTGVIQIYVADR